ncbi:hypothetical protein [Poseidonocella sp. HB161398]|uniref:hypothetical protein n=1 Tax=Poseidonocella sp. HB161398 TaxID=2320855 RepID=UPI00197D0A6F|nr:hypothetical protein [Poseidonocella sp. HB161398]
MPSLLDDADLGSVVLELEHAAPCGVGYRAEIAADRNHALFADPPLDRQDRVIGQGGQRPEAGQLLGEGLVDHPPGGGVGTGIGDPGAPFGELRVDVNEVAEGPGEEFKRMANGPGDRLQRRTSWWM